MEQKSSLLEPTPELWKFPRKRSKRYQNLRTEEQNLSDLNNEGHNEVKEDFSDSPHLNK